MRSDEPHARWLNREDTILERINNTKPFILTINAFKACTMCN